MKRSLSRLVVALFVAAVGTTAMAQSANVTVQAAVSKACRVGVDAAISFATPYDPTSGTALVSDGTAALQIRCTKDVLYKYSVGTGGAGSVGSAVRGMRNGALDVLSYTLAAKVGAAGTFADVLADAAPANGEVAANPGTPMNLFFRATVPAQQLVSPAVDGELYNDTVVVTFSM